MKLVTSLSALLTSLAITHRMYWLWHFRKHVIFAPLGYDRNIIINQCFITNWTKVVLKIVYQPDQPAMCQHKFCKTYNTEKTTKTRTQAQWKLCHYRIWHSWYIAVSFWRWIHPVFSLSPRLSSPHQYIIVTTAVESFVFQRQEWCLEAKTWGWGGHWNKLWK